MKQVKIIPHVADTRLFVAASTYEELFNAALSGMSSIIKTDFCLTAQTTDEDIILLEAPDETFLLIDFLAQVLTLTQIKKTIYCKASFLHLTDTSMHAKIYGTKVEAFDKEINAVTYHEADIKKGKSGLWETVIVFDI